MSDPVLLDYPFVGRWMARNSPARRVPSHGTSLFGSSYAIDLIGVDGRGRGRSAPGGWGAAVATEPHERIAGFGRTLRSPVAGRVISVHDQEVDRRACRSVPAGLVLLLGQARQVRAGSVGVSGNHIVITSSERGPFVLLAHLRQGSARVRVGDRVRAGEAIAGCAGNSVQSHVHLQVTDSVDWPAARGLPIRFRSADGGVPVLPRESEIVTIPPVGYYA